jgi:hypothetical protein
VSRERTLIWMLGALALLPLGYAVYLGASPLWTPVGETAHTLYFEPPTHLDFIFLAALLAGVASSIFYLYRRSRIPPEKRSIWLVFIILFSLISVPLFWYSQLARNPTQDESTTNV